MSACTHTHFCCDLAVNVLFKLHRLNEGNNLVSTDQVNVSGSHDLNSYTFTNLNGGSYGVTITSISIANGQYFKGQPSTSISFTIGMTIYVELKCNTQMHHVHKLNLI